MIFPVLLETCLVLWVALKLTTFPAGKINNTFGIVIASQGSGPVQVETEGSDLPWLCYSSSYLAQCRESDLRCMAWPCRENRVYALRRKPCDT